MFLTSLKLTGFRNFLSLQLLPQETVNIFYGNNGAGKTNLLESIFVLCLGRSHRGAGDTIMLNSSSEVYRIEGKLNLNGREIDIAVAYQAGGRKKIMVDGISIRTAELYEQFSVVSSGPEDSEILQGPPSVRRTFVDIYLAQISRQYLATLTDYQRTLAQKNAALKAEQDPMPFDALLVPLGASITRSRAVFLEQLGQQAKQYYQNLSQGGQLTLSYKPSAIPGHKIENLDNVESAFQQRLQDNRQREMIMKTSLIGPHRDDIIFHIGEYPARTHASQGEIRSAAVSLKLAVFHLLKEKRESTPILLLDEVFAELDSERAAALVTLFGDFGQIFLTTALDPPEPLRQRGSSFYIRNGAIEGGV